MFPRFPRSSLLGLFLSLSLSCFWKKAIKGKKMTDNKYGWTEVHYDRRRERTQYARDQRYGGVLWMEGPCTSHLLLEEGFCPLTLPLMTVTAHPRYKTHNLPSIFSRRTPLLTAIQTDQQIIFQTHTSNTPQTNHGQSHLIPHIPTRYDKTGHSTY